MGIPFICACAAFAMSCSPATRHAALSTFFDGVPPPSAKKAQEQEGGAIGTRPVRTRAFGYGEHGPYAAKLCSACHESIATNTLVAPKEELCLHCHKLKLDKESVHAPIAAGACMECHDPHSSQYRALLLSEPDSLCFRCHDREAVEKVEAHAGSKGTCTDCHDPHTSDRKYLLK